ncbi:MAG: hypothetical protein JO091_11070, partial [Acidobacteriaceae bacterium]|nr:hypothetical protein [Acidobacteriaceae bacterium]
MEQALSSRNPGFQKFTDALLVMSLLLQTGLLVYVKPAHAHDVSPHEVGVVYYANGREFVAIAKEIAPQSGRHNYSARVKGAHATLRLPAGRPQ